MTPNRIADLFSGEKFQWQMRFERGDMQSFFAPGPDNSRVLAERKRWLRESREKYATLRPDGIPLLDETIRLAAENKAITRDQQQELDSYSDPLHRYRRLGELWEADFVLLGPSLEMPLIIQGGIVCFPSHWSLPDKVGKTMQSVHSPVPQLNDAIGRQIDLFLDRMKPGVVSLRSNWGIVRTGELNQHPDRKLPRLSPPVRLEESFLRIERQLLMSLPATKGVLFGIRIEQLSLATVKDDPRAAAALVHGLRTMDESIARYKGFADVRAELIDQLGSSSQNQGNPLEC